MPVGKWSLFASLGALGVVAVAMLVLGNRYVTQEADPRGAENPDYSFVSKVVTLKDTLWLTGGGKLTALDLRDFSKKDFYEAGVIDIGLMDGELWLVVSSNADRPAVQLMTLNGTSFETRRRIQFATHDLPSAIAFGTNDLVLISDRSLSVVSPTGGAVRRVQLSQEIGAFPFRAAVTSDGRNLYIGENKGEFGGGLRLINLKTGEVTLIERRDSGDLCAGPLNASCDPVTALLPDSANPACVIAAVGLAHLSLREGRILRVCGKDVEVVFEQPVKLKHNIDGSDPIYDLQLASNGVWAVGLRGLYFLSGHMVRKFELPKIEVAPGLYTNGGTKKLLLVKSGANSAFTPHLALAQ